MSDICLPLILEMLIGRGLWQTGFCFETCYPCPVVGNYSETAGCFTDLCISREKFDIFFQKKVKVLFDIVW